MRLRADISPAALLLFSLAYFFDGSGAFSVLVPAAAVHELGHLAALRLEHIGVRRIRLTVTGLVIEPDGRPVSRFENIMSTVAGPAAGLAFSLASLCFSGAYIRLCGAVSFWLSVLNLVPAYPLDGGRIFRELLPRRAFAVLTGAASAAMLILGLAVYMVYGAVIPMLFGVWLLAVNICRSSV